MEDKQFAHCRYTVSALQGFTLTEALRFWKAKFETVKHFRRDVITHTKLEGFGQFVEELWATIKPITVIEALREHNTERRRVMFDCIGVARLFAELDPELLDKQTVNKTRFRWDEHGKPREHRFEDHYELYKIEGDKLFTPISQWNSPRPVYAVRCWCTTTGREYWIYVPEEAAMGTRLRSYDSTMSEPDAIRAIAWTIRIDIPNPKRIYRQGDIIIAAESDDSRTVPAYHLTKEQYLQLMYSET